MGSNLYGLDAGLHPHFSETNNHMIRVRESEGKGRCVHTGKITVSEGLELVPGGIRRFVFLLGVGDGGQQ